MITINANMNNKVFLQGIATYPYYLFVFTQGNCIEYVEAITPETNCADGVFEINVNLPMGTYQLNVYGQIDYSNTLPELAEYVTTESCVVYNPEKICWANGVLTDEFNYPLQDENLNDLLR